MKRLFPAISVVVLALMLAACSSSDKPAVSRQGKAPGFALEGMDGKTVDFKQYQGKLVLVDFWATWCPPCRRSIPDLAELHKKYSNRGFEVVGVSLDQTGRESVASFARENAIPYTILMGTQDVATRWDIGSGIPVAILVSRDGSVVEKVVGYKDTHFWEQKIAQYL
ncbi:MAG: redoxin domain-containing protein [Candidatus Zixiibacteriota bacterium]